jgi:hypothetical protein
MVGSSEPLAASAGVVRREHSGLTLRLPLTRSSLLTDTVPRWLAGPPGCLPLE